VSAKVSHTVTIGQTTTVADLRRGLARCPRDARVTVSYSDIKATWVVHVEPAPPGATS
jgi:uncharacterized repeat protein (TIGR03917 family)